MEWTEDSISRLRALWSDGHSTAEIGRRLGISKNAVVGKAHRLDLPARPSPIRRDGPRSGPRPAPRRIAGPTLPPLPSAERPTPAITLAARHAESRAPIPPPMTNPPRTLPLPSRPYGRTVACCWPIGEPGTKDFRFCDEISVPAKPYCARHAQLAYVKLRDRRDDAA